MALASGKGVEGVPVRAAEPGKRLAGSRPGRVTGGKDIVPARRLEPPRPRSRTLRISGKHVSSILAPGASGGQVPRAFPRERFEGRRGRTRVTPHHTHLQRNPSKVTAAGCPDPRQHFSAPVLVTSASFRVSPERRA